MRTGLYPEHTLTLARNCSAALAASIAERLQTVLSASAPCTVLTTYAMTECVPICSNPRNGVQKLDSVGPPAGPGVNILLTDGVTLTAAPDVEGEVCVKGACCTAGYEVRPGDGILRTWACCLMLVTNTRVFHSSTLLPPPTHAVRRALFATMLLTC